MSRWETYLALVAVVLASLSAVKIGGHPRPVLALAAIVLLAMLAYTRLRASFTGKKKASHSFDAYDRALDIQERRDRKFRR